MCGSDLSTLTETDLAQFAARTTPQKPLAGSVSSISEPAPRVGFDLVFNFQTAIPASALTAFDQIERYLETRFSDDAKVVIDVRFETFAPSLLGTTVNNFVSLPYSLVRDGLVADADPDDVIQALLPLGTTVPVRTSAVSETVIDMDSVWVSIANHEAAIGAIDTVAATMTFNDAINWAFLPQDVVRAICSNTASTLCCSSSDCPGLPGVCNTSPTSCVNNTDCPNGGLCGTSAICEPRVFSFSDILLHEVGHVLGFTSALDDGSANLETLDLFRFQRSDGSGTNHNPDTLAEFTTTPRLMDSAPPSPFDLDDVNLDIIVREHRMSDGNPNQASHFSDLDIVENVMEPLFCPGKTLFPVRLRQGDLDMLDAIGWDFPPANTTCTNASLLLCGTSRQFDNSFVGGPPSPAMNCGLGTSHTGAMWFSFTATSTSSRVGTCQSLAGDSTMSVYAGQCGSLVEIACSEDNACQSPGNLASVCLTGLTVGETYYVQVASKSPSDLGVYEIELQCGCDAQCADTCCIPPPTPTLPPGSIDTNRFLAFVLSAPTERAAIRVTLQSLQNPQPPNLPGSPPPDYSTQQGTVRWLGNVEAYVDSPTFGTSFRATKTQCSPRYADWSFETLLHVTGAAIVPSSVYQVDILTEACMELHGENGPDGFSGQLQLSTARWGDVSSPFQDPTAGASITQPDVNDIIHLVDRVRDIAFAIPRAQAQLVPLTISFSQTPNVLDISTVVDTVKRIPFPFPQIDSCTP